MSSLIDLLTSATQIIIEYYGIDDGGDYSSDFNRKFFPRLQYDSRVTYLDT